MCSTSSSSSNPNPPPSRDYHLFNVALLGSSRVGKTSLLRVIGQNDRIFNDFVLRQFNIKNPYYHYYEANEDNNNHEKQYTRILNSFPEQENVLVKLQIWDQWWRYSIYPVRGITFRFGAVLLMFDLTNKQTLTDITSVYINLVIDSSVLYIKYMKDHFNIDENVFTPIPIYLIGGKSDLLTSNEEKQVFTEFVTKGEIENLLYRMNRFDFTQEEIQNNIKYPDKLQPNLSNIPIPSVSREAKEAFIKNLPQCFQKNSEAEKRLFHTVYETIPILPEVLIELVIEYMIDPGLNVEYISTSAMTGENCELVGLRIVTDILKNERLVDFLQRKKIEPVKTKGWLSSCVIN